MQPAGVAVPAGYVADTGSAFGDRGNGFSYGWDSDVSSAARDRNDADDQRFDTFIHTQLGGSNHTWEIAVPNGTFSVHIVAGDMDYTDSVYRFNAESTTVFGGTPNAGARFIGGTATVTVSDGRLTISNAPGSSNNKLDFVDITSVDQGPPVSSTPTPPTPPPPVQSGNTPFRGTAWLAGQPIEAEDYDLGGEGVAYHDTTSDHLGGGYRSDAVDVQSGGSQWVQHWVYAGG